MTGHEVDSRAFEMKYADFMSEFMQYEGEDKEAEEIKKIVDELGAVPEVLQDLGGDETIRYTPLIKMIQRAWDGTEYVARNVHRWGDDSGLNINRIPDIACYKTADGTTKYDLPRNKTEHTSDSHDDTSSVDNPANNTSHSVESAATTDTNSLDKDEDDNNDGVNPTLNAATQDTTTSPSDTDEKYPPHAARMEYSACKLSIEDKTSHVRASFNWDSDSIWEFLPQGTDRINARGRIGEHATIIMERQHRTHFFSVVTIGFTARFLRWDRSGVIVTKPIRFDKNPTRFICLDADVCILFIIIFK
ncbi:hypothetical protein C8Q75DRAFT_324632 [Abortiporus biennis]|nr:hypothetical protein C8Q75DRAFT_324632 [Abortiporus biennis]